MNHGISILDFRELAYEYTKATNGNIPTSGNKHTMAEKDSAKRFGDRNNPLPLRSPKATSLARSRAFNHSINSLKPLGQQFKVRFQFRTRIFAIEKLQQL